MHCDVLILLIKLNFTKVAIELRHILGKSVLFGGLLPAQLFSLLTCSNYGFSLYLVLMV